MVETEQDVCTSPEQAFERHFTMVWRSLRRLGVPASALDDAAQDVFLVLHRRWLDFQHQSSLKTWIYGILLRVASDHKRRARRERARWSPEPAEIESPNETPDRILQQREASRLLHVALNQLDDKERQMLVLVDLEEGSVVDAADALGINLNTAYSRLRRGRQSFEKALRAASASGGAVAVSSAGVSSVAVSSAFASSVSGASGSRVRSEGGDAVAESPTDRKTTNITSETNGE